MQLNNAIQKKRGCHYCLDKVWGKYSLCPHAECPYHELDQHDTYQDFLKSTGRLSVVKILQEMGESVTAGD